MFALMPQARPDLDFQRVEATRPQLAKGQLPAKSRTLLEKAANGPRPDLALASIAKLEWAVQLHLYPQAKLLKTLERQADVAKAWFGVNFVAEYGRTLGLKLPGDRVLDAAGSELMMLHESPFQYTEADKEFLKRCFAAHTISGRLDATYAILPKKRLPNKARGWIQDQLHRTASKPGPERELWAMVARVARYRGAG